jgi:hypothetical protein
MTVLVTPLFAAERGRLDDSSCRASLWHHVYHPDRFTTIEACFAVTGVIEDWRLEKDGDLHILLRLDRGQASLLNGKNKSDQEGCLVVEPICERNVTQPDAISACKGAFRVKIPQKGSHVQVIGTYVRDEQHGWMEIHPVSKFVVLDEEP